MAAHIRDRYGWIGLGNMGLAMAKNLQRHISNNTGLSPLIYTNRTLSRGDYLGALGAQSLSTPANVVKHSDVIFVSLSDDAAVQSTIQSIIAEVPFLTSKLLIDTTTVHPNTTSAINDLVLAAGGTYLSSPVFGGTPIAVSGQLLFALGGPSAAIDRVKPLIEACLARSVIIAGPEPKNAMLLKATGNFITAGLAELLSEAFVLTEKSGLDSSVVEDLVQQNYGSYAASIADKLTSGVYAPPEGERPRSDVRLAVKDVLVGVNIARETGVELELGEICLKRLEEARKWGEDEGRALDSSSVYGIARVRAGLEFEREDVLERRRLEKERAGGD